MNSDAATVAACAESLTYACSNLARWCSNASENACSAYLQAEAPVLERFQRDAALTSLQKSLLIYTPISSNKVKCPLGDGLGRCIRTQNVCTASTCAC